MKKVLAALAASGVLVAGGFATAAVSTPGAATAQESTEEAPIEGTDGEERPTPGAMLDEVFADLVADGVITEDQADQVRAALEAKRAELGERLRDRRDHRRGFALHGALEDGVIDADELAELPDGHPLTDPDGPFAEYLEDGQITQDELEEIRAEFGGDRHRFRGFGGFGPDAPGEDASISA